MLPRSENAFSLQGRKEKEKRRGGPPLQLPEKKRRKSLILNMQKKEFTARGKKEENRLSQLTIGKGSVFMEGKKAWGEDSIHERKRNKKALNYSRKEGEGED